MVKMLPKSVLLLGRDIPELVRIGSPEEALVATMQTQANRKREEEKTTLVDMQKFVTNACIEC